MPAGSGSPFGAWAHRPACRSSCCSTSAATWTTGIRRSSTDWLQIGPAWGTADGGAAARLKAVKQPILVVNGSHDIMIPTVNAFELSRRLPNAELILYPDAGHGSMFQYPEWFVDDASRLLARN